MNFSPCPVCGRRFEFELSVCEFCRVPEHMGERCVRVRLWHVTEARAARCTTRPGHSRRRSDE
jgi:hypothetical protein